MPVTIRNGQVKIKGTNGYVSVDTLADSTTTSRIAAINAAGTEALGNIQDEGAAQVAAIEQKGEDVLADIPADYTELSDAVSELNSALQDTVYDLEFGEKQEGHYLSNGNYDSNSWYHCYLTNKIPCVPGTVFVYRGGSYGGDPSALFYKNDSFVSGTHFDISNDERTITAPEDIDEVMFQVCTGGNNNPGSIYVYQVVPPSVQYIKLLSAKYIQENTIRPLKIAQSEITWTETQQGRYNPTGVYIEGWNYRSSHTNLILCNEGDTFLYTGFSGNYANDCPSVLFYDEKKGFISSLPGISTNPPTQQVTIPSGVSYVMFQLAKNMTSGDVGERSVVAVDPTSIKNIVDSIDNINGALSGKKLIVSEEPNNLLDSTEIIGGRLNESTGAVETSNNYLVTDFIEVEPFTEYITARLDTYSVYGTTMCFYDQEQQFITKDRHVAERDSDVKYMRFCFSTYAYENYSVWAGKYSDISKKLYEVVNNDLSPEEARIVVRKAVEENNYFFNVSKNLFDFYNSEWCLMRELQTDGGIKDATVNLSNSGIVVKYIPVNAGDVLYSNINAWMYCLYDEDKNFIQSLTTKPLDCQYIYPYCVPENSTAKYMSIGFVYSPNGAHGYDTDKPNGYIRSYNEISKLVIWKKEETCFYPKDYSQILPYPNYQIPEEYVNLKYNQLPEMGSEFMRMIRCEAIRAVNHTKHIFRIGSFNQYIGRGNENWAIIKKMLGDYGIDICGFQEAQYFASQDVSMQASIGDYMKGWQFKYSASFYPEGTTDSPYSNRDMVSFFPVVESEELKWPDVGQGGYNNRSALRTKIKLPRFLDCTGGDQYLGFYVIHPTVNAGPDKQKAEYQVCLDAMETDGCAFHIIAADTNAFNFDETTGEHITWKWLKEKGFKLANDGLSKTVTDPSPNHQGSIDQIFVSENIDIVNFNVINSNEYPVILSDGRVFPLSDHDFIYADVVFKYDDIVTRLRPMTEVALIQYLTNTTSDTPDNYHITGNRDEWGNILIADDIVVHLTAESGYTLGTVTVKIGNTDKTSTYYSNGTITIPAGTAVNGDIIITAESTAT